MKQRKNKKINANTKNIWGLATKEGKILEKFKRKHTARNWKPKLEEIHLTKLEIIRL